MVRVSVNKVLRFWGFISLLSLAACTYAVSARAGVFVLISCCALQKQEITSPSWKPSAHPRLNYVTPSPYHLPFNLPDSIWNPVASRRDRGWLREQGLQRGVWLSVCVRRCVCVCVRCVLMCVRVSSRQQWVVSNTLPGIKHSACGLRPHTDPPLWNANSARPDWLNDWLIDCLIDWLFDWFDCFLSLSGGVFFSGITANWRNTGMFLVNKLWLAQCGTTTILTAFLSRVQHWRGFGAHMLPLWMIRATPQMH